MKTKIIFISVVSFGLSCLEANPRILIDGIHGWPTPHANMGEVSDPVELFPEYEFDYLDAGDVIIDQVLVSGVLQSSQDTIVFMVPEDSPVLYLRYELEDTTSFQHPFFFFIDPLGEFAGSNANGLAYVEMPASGLWSVIYSAWDLEGLAYEIGFGSHFYQDTRLSQYDLVLQMVDNTFSLFSGYLPTLSEYETSQLTNYVENGGGYLLLRETDWSMVDKPIIHLSAAMASQVDLTLNFPGVPTFLVPPAHISREANHSNLQWKVDVKPDEITEILYEGRPRTGLNFLSVTAKGSNMEIENHSELPLASIRVFQPESGGLYRYARVESLEPAERMICSNYQTFRPLELSAFLQRELEAEALALGLSTEEALSFFKEYQWINRLLASASPTHSPCAIFNFSGDAYDRFIPLNVTNNFSEQVRIMWVFVENTPTQIQGSSFIPDKVISQSILSRELQETLIFHEYGVTEEHNPLSPTLREMTLFNSEFTDYILIDETNNQDGNAWTPVFHTFGSNPLAHILTEGVDALFGNLSSPISILGASAFVVVSGDDDTHSESPEVFPPGSHPPVAVAEFIGEGTFIGINDINIMSSHPGNRRFLQNCIDYLADSETQTIHVPEDVTTIQAAIDSARHGDSVLVGPGMYQENINFLGKAISVTSTGGAESTIIWGDSSFSVVSFVSGEDQGSVIRGFTIRGGNVYDSGPLLHGGGGIRCIGSSPMIIENIITSNHCEFYLDGGGIFCSDASPKILDNTISANTGAYNGGGICLRNASSPLIQGNIIEANVTSSGWGFAYGAGIFIDVGSDPVITENRIQANVIDTGSGAGICVRGPGSTLISHNLIVGNIGAGIACTDSSLARIVSNTISANNTGIFVETNAHPRLVNSVIWDNPIVVIQEFDLSAISIAYSNIENGWEGPGNIHMDPLFVNQAAGDFSLMETSPCVDGGTDFYVFEMDTIVNLGSADYLGNAPDIGSIESPFVVRVLGSSTMPTAFELKQNYPNPFNPQTIIKYGLPETSQVKLAVFNVKGQEIALLVEGQQSAGWHECTWSGTDQSGKALDSGLFFTRLETGSMSKVIKMLYLK